jgi:adenine-specific DNA methylase
MAYPKRLIEIDLPIKRISAHARREKSIRHGHISTLHIWWARRPLAACRAVLCAALWPAPTDSLCPPSFCDAARTEMRRWTANQRLKLLGGESQARFQRLANDPTLLNDDAHLQQALFDFIADFANWDNSTNQDYLETARTLTQAAHEGLGGLPGTRPLVADPFAGGGSIPLEALRIGADAFASDLNPVAVLLNKVVLEYIPKYGKAELRMRNADGEEVTFHGLANAVRYWGNWIKEQAEQELAPFYPKDPDGATPIAYLWARTIICEGPGCGAEVPLMRSKWLAKREKSRWAYAWFLNALRNG